MIKTKKQSLIVIGAFALVMLLGTVTYAFFNYTRTGSSNVIKTGRISFNSEQGNAINLTNMFPIDTSVTGIMDDATKVGTVTIHVTGDTTYSEGIEYLVSAVNVQNTIGTKKVPISINVSVQNNNESSLGTSDTDYFINRGTSAQASIYKVLATDTINEDDRLVVGYIKSGQDGVDGNIVIKAYLDREKVAISDTYDGTESDTNGTTNDWVDERVILTTNEWNSLQQDGVSFQVKVEANEGVWVTAPAITITYNLSGGTMNSTIKTIDGTATTYGELGTPTKDNSLFEGWYTDETGGTKVDDSTSFVYGISPTTLYAHWTPIPTTMEEMCPNCIYTYYNFCENNLTCVLQSAWNNENNPVAKITDLEVIYYDYEDALSASPSSIFLGLVANNNDEIEKVYICGLSKTSIPFCINGTTDESGDNLNRAILSSVGCVNNSCYDDAYFSVDIYGISAYSGPFGCGISRSDGRFQCYEQ